MLDKGNVLRFLLGLSEGFCDNSFMTFYASLMHKNSSLKRLLKNTEILAQLNISIATFICFLQVK